MGGQLLAFLGVSLVVIVVPGPDTALTVRNALTGGRHAGVATAAGVATGQAVWTVASGVGIAELIQASEPAFLVMRAVGAAYLIALGLQSLWTALWTTRRPELAGGLPSRLGPPAPPGCGEARPGAEETRAEETRPRIGSGRRGPGAWVDEPQPGTAAGSCQ